MNFQFKYVKGESSEGVPQGWIEVRKQVSDTTSVVACCIPCTEETAAMVTLKLNELLHGVFTDGERYGKESIRDALRVIIGCEKSR